MIYMYIYLIISDILDSSLLESTADPIDKDCNAQRGDEHTEDYLENVDDEHFQLKRND